jgi:hypothetical protein
MSAKSCDAGSSSPFVRNNSVRADPRREVTTGSGVCDPILDAEALIPEFLSHVMLFVSVRCFDLLGVEHSPNENLRPAEIIEE